MFYVPLYVEAIRSRPLLLFWAATLAQAAIWFAVPALFYASPPGELAQTLALGHGFDLAGDTGPPLAYWLAAAVFRAAGLFGIYALAQVCVIATYWCVFALSRAIVGASHAAVAVLLMVGISVFTLPTPDFGVSVLAMPLWAAALLFYWRAAMQKQARSWYLFGAAAALLLVTTNAALIFLGALMLFTAATGRGRAALTSSHPWIVVIVLSAFLFLHLIWLQGEGDKFTTALARLRMAEAARQNTTATLRLLFALALTHAGLAILVMLGCGWPHAPANPAPPLSRLPVDPTAASFVKVFALWPALLAISFAVVANEPQPVGGLAPLLVLSGLATVVAAGDAITLYHQRILGYAWAGLLVVPALFVPIVIATLPWATGTELKIAQPAGAMGRFFANTFARRTGQPLAVVTGDARMAMLIAISASSRPGVFLPADPAHSPDVTLDDIRKKGAVVVWPAAGTSPVPPPEIKAYFPDLVAEVPQIFARPIEGRLPPFRIGWGVIRPGSVAPTPH